MAEEQIKPTEQKTANPVDPGTKLFQAKEYFKEFFLDVFDLDHGVDKRAVIADIKAKNSMSGANAWMLMCSIVIASIGLDLNSQAVIIGAMLISPLMSPILGIGLSVGINDTNTLKKSLSHFAIAIAIALITSTVYFYLSPFDQITEQIKARTEPTFLDVLIAFFGGIAGIVSTARKDISTTIPGVAIATALMPPLCVTGFGIANAENWDVALSSFYLFFVNTFFVALATFLIVKLLKFPTNQYIDKKTNRRNMIYMAIFSLVVSIPSFLIFSKVYKRISSQSTIDRFINEVIAEDQIYLDDYQFVTADTINRLLLKVYGDKISMDNAALYSEKLQEMGMKNTKVQIIPTSEINLDRINKLENEIDGVQMMTEKLSIVQNEKKQRDQAITELEEQINSYRIDSLEFAKLCLGLQAIQEDILSVSFSSGQKYDFNEYQEKVPIVVLEWNSRARTLSQKQSQVEKYLSIQFAPKEVTVVHKNNR